MSMLLRGAVAVGGTAAIPLAIGTAHCDTKGETKSGGCCGGTKTLKAKELPLYAEPPIPEVEYIPEKTNAYTDTISSSRKAVFEYYDSMKETRDKLQDKWGVAKAHTNDLLNTLQEDSGVVPRAVFITVAGLGGVVAGYKGGIMRKTLFAATGMGAAASICYPNQAVDISKQGWGTVRDTVKEILSAGPAPSPVAKKITEEANKSLDQLAAESTDSKTETTGTDSKQSSSSTDKTPAKVEGDPGMSKPEDKDMYSTRK